MYISVKFEGRENNEVRPGCELVLIHPDHLIDIYKNPHEILPSLPDLYTSWLTRSTMKDFTVHKQSRYIPLKHATECYVVQTWSIDLDNSINIGANEYSVPSISLESVFPVDLLNDNVDFFRGYKETHSLFSRIQSERFSLIREFDTI